VLSRDGPSEDWSEPGCLFCNEITQAETWMQLQLSGASPPDDVEPFSVLLHLRVFFCRQLRPLRDRHTYVGSVLLRRSVFRGERVHELDVVEGDAWARNGTPGELVAIIAESSSLV
jgi:hypothetical protein